MNDHLNIVINNLASGNFNENKHLISYEDFHQSLNQCILLCERHSDKINQGRNEEEYWFLVLEQLYNINFRLKSHDIEGKHEYINEIIEYISKNITELLEKMCNYVSIQAIINVTFTI